MRIKKIELPPALINMWDGAFARSSIEEIVLPDKVTSIVEKDPSNSFSRTLPSL